MHIHADILMYVSNTGRAYAIWIALYLVHIIVHMSAVCASNTNTYINPYVCCMCFRYMHICIGRITDVCEIVFCMRKCENLLYLCCEKVHSVLHSASEIMRWGDLINTCGEAPEQSHKINVKAPGKNLNHRSSDGKTLLGHARKKLCAQMLGSAIQGI